MTFLTMQIETLPSKFLPYLIGSESKPSAPDKPSKADIDEVFKQLAPSGEDRTYVRMGEEWVIKGRRLEGGLTSDSSNVYRLRKAKKIFEYIKKKGLMGHFIVPKKFLYRHEGDKQFYVVSQRLKLSKATALPHPKYLRNLLFTANPSGQVKRFQEDTMSDGKLDLAKFNEAVRFRKIKKITPIQAKVLAELSFEAGFTDLTYNNMYFVDDKFAIIDTEALSRDEKKKWSWLLGKSALKIQQGLEGIREFKWICPTPEALQAVEEVEAKYALIGIAKIIFKVALSVFFLYSLFACPTFFPMMAGRMDFHVLKISLVSVIAVNGVIGAYNVFKICSLWSLSLRTERIESWEVVEEPH